MTLDIAQGAALLAIVALLLRILANQRTAAAVARETKHEASAAASDAAVAARTARTILDRLETGGRDTRQAAGRIEDAAAVVAEDLQTQHDRADAVTSNEPGAAADAAATSPDRESA